MKKSKQKSQVVIYQAKSGAIELRGDFSRETVWASRMQMAEIFGVNPQAISKHIQNIYKEKELQRNSTSSILELVQDESGRQVHRNIDIYNLDVLIAVGYRINSVVGTKFRQWATKTLHEYITKGYAVNRKQIAKNYNAFMRAVGDIQMLLPESISFDPKNVLELVKEFASTWISLDAYDKESLKVIGVTKKAVKLAGEELGKVIQNFRSEIIKKGEATGMFAQERVEGSIAGIVGNVMQSFGGKPIYATVEEKAAHLLYFMIKDHPFIDGNKRSGAFAFVWFLRKARVKGGRNINPASLTAIALLIAESDPKKKDQMVALITQMLR